MPPNAMILERKENCNLENQAFHEVEHGVFVFLLFVTFAVTTFPSPAQEPLSLSLLPRSYREGHLMHAGLCENTARAVRLLNRRSIASLPEAVTLGETAD